MRTTEHARNAGKLVRKFGKHFPKERAVEGLKLGMMLAEANEGVVTPQSARELAAWVPTADDIAAFWEGYNAI